MKSVLPKVFLIIRTVVRNQLLLALSLVHLEGVVDPVQLSDLAFGIEQMGKLMIPRTQLLLQLCHVLGRIDGRSELRLKEGPQL